MSEYVRNTSPTTSVNIGTFGNDAGVVFNSSISYPWIVLPPNSGWTRISVPINIVSFPTHISGKLRFENATTLTDGYVQFAGLKFEQGSIATDWTPAPEDKADASLVSTLQTQVDNSAVGTNLLAGTSGQLKTGVIKKGTFHQDAIPWIRIIAGNYYTYRSFITNSQIDLEAGIDFFNSNHDWIGYAGGNIVKAGTSGYSTVKFMARDEAYFINPVYARVTQSPYGEDKSISWSQEKLEKGSVATDWCPNPEDKVNVADMRKRASDVAGIEEVNTKQDKIGYTPADDSKVLHYQ